MTQPQEVWQLTASQRLQTGKKVAAGERTVWTPQLYCNMWEKTSHSDYPAEFSWGHAAYILLSFLGGFLVNPQLMKLDGIPWDDPRHDIVVLQILQQRHLLVVKRRPKKRRDSWATVVKDGYKITSPTPFEKIWDLPIRNHATRGFRGQTKIPRFLFRLSTTTKVHKGKRPTDCRASRFHMNAYECRLLIESRQQNIPWFRVAMFH